MRGLRKARLAILAFLAIFATVILVLIFRGSPERPAPVEARVVPEAPPALPVEGTVESAAETFLFTEEKGGQVVTRLRAGRMLGVEGGSRVLSEIALEFCPDPQNHPDRLALIEGSAGRFDAARKAVELQDEVNIRLASGESLQTTRLTYSMDTRTAETEAHVQFQLETLTGEAHGMTALLGDEMLQLHRDVRIAPAGATTDREVDVEADSLEYDGIAQRMTLGGQVSLAGAWGRFLGQDMVMDASGTHSLAQTPGPGSLHILADDGATHFILSGRAWQFELDAQHQLQSVETRADALLRPGEGDDRLGLQQLRAARIELKPAAGAQDRDILVAARSRKQPVEARLSRGPLDAVLADSLRLETGPGDDGWARFEGQVKGTGPGRSASGDALLAYRDGRIALIGQATRPARLVEPQRALAAREILYDGQGEGTATGEVHLNGLPDSGDRRIAATADEASFSSLQGLIRLQGGVRAWQGSDTLQADWLTVREEGEVLRAGGSVVASLGSAAQEEGRLQASARTRIASRNLIWQRGLERAAFTGDVLLTRGGMMLQTVELELQTGEREQRAFSAAGQVKIRDLTWSGSGDRLYTLPDETLYHLQADDGLATVTSLPSGNTLQGAHLAVDPDSGLAHVSGLPGGRILLSSRNRPAGDAK